MGTMASLSTGRQVESEFTKVHSISLPARVWNSLTGAIVRIDVISECCHDVVTLWTP